MGAFANLGSFFGENLVTIAKKCGYQQSNILILEGKIGEPTMFPINNNSVFSPNNSAKRIASFNPFSSPHI